MKKILTFTVLPLLLIIAACNTVKGVGKDVSSAGNAVTNAANDVKNRM